MQTSAPIILVASDKGLCGALNSNLFRLAGRFDPHSTVFITAGRKAAQFVARTRRQLIAEFPVRRHAAVRRSPRDRGAGPRSVPEGRGGRGPDRRHALRQHADAAAGRRSSFFRSATSTDWTFPGRTPTKRRWPPTPPSSCSSRAPDDILGYLLGHYLNIFIYTVLLNAKASEQSARMVSMKSATDNADEMIKDLTLDYNKLRQGHITQELLEIAGGQSGNELRGYGYEHRHDRSSRSVRSWTSRFPSALPGDLRTR